MVTAASVRLGASNGDTTVRAVDEHGLLVGEGLSGVVDGLCSSSYGESKCEDGCNKANFYVFLHIVYFLLFCECVKGRFGRSELGIYLFLTLERVCMGYIREYEVVSGA